LAKFKHGKRRHTHKIFISPSKIPLWRRGFCTLLLSFRINYLAVATAQQGTLGTPDTAPYHWKLHAYRQSCWFQCWNDEDKEQEGQLCQAHFLSLGHSALDVVQLWPYHQSYQGGHTPNYNTDSSAAISRRSGYKWIQNMQVKACGIQQTCHANFTFILPCIVTDFFFN